MRSKIWREAMLEEHKSIEKNYTCELDDLQEKENYSCEVNL